MRFLALLVILGSFSTTAFAVDAARCPRDFSATLSPITAYKTSRYSGVPGWIESRDALATQAGGVRLEFRLASQQNGECRYRDRDGMFAKFSTETYYDPETGGENDYYDRLVVLFKVRGKAFSVVTAVQEYSPAGLRSYQNPANREVSTRLQNLYYVIGTAKLDLN
ncbi:MAG: hypothetical protein A2X94_11630 [Bdellovibrionales bacterium GWB1_55_8]|nr:MAG: hypothetical protein A2X94_11630 [Bdellovibrionales bacterium GWB1_55_8]